jgi:hypothetical protein
MSIIAGGSNGITFPNSTNTPAACVTTQFTPYITDTSNVMTVNPSVKFCGANGVITPNGTYTVPQFIYIISTNQTNLCMRAGAVSAGWNGTAKLIVNINSGVVISASSTSTPAMTILGSYPATVIVNNSGTIVGMGGGGGTGGGSGYTPTGGAGGGTALKASSAVTFNNTSGVIAGGGGGGAGGAQSGDFGGIAGGGGGGGGRSSNFNSPGGGGRNSGASGCPGTFAGAGAGGAGGVVVDCYCNTYVGSPGSSGGGWGCGKATCGAGTYITWSGTGTRYGSIS